MTKILSAASAAIAVLSLIAGPASATDYKPPFPPIVGIGGQTRLIYPDFPVEMLVTEAESGGQFGMLVLYSKPNEGTPGVDALLEYKLTETFYVLAGTYRFAVGDNTVEGGPGTVIVNPPNVPHGFVNIGASVGKLLVVYTPVDGTHGTSSFAQWAEQSTRSPAWIAKTNTAYGIDRPAP